MHDLEHVLLGEGLEVEAVGGVVVGGDRLGVAVEHHGLEPGRPQRGRRVHAGVVELDALPDAVRPGAQDDHLGPLGLLGDLGLRGGVGLVGRVVVRRAGGELRGARVDGLEDRPHAEAVPQRPHPPLAGELGARPGDLEVGQARALGPAQQRGVEDRRVADLAAQRHQALDLLDEPRVDPGRLVDLGDGRPEPQGPLDGVEAAVARERRLVQQRLERVVTLGVRSGPEARRRRSRWSAAPC